MPRYMAKKMTVEAMELTAETFFEVVNWIGHSLCATWERDEKHILIFTPQGRQQANLGDFVIKFASGELYVCKPDRFAATYEPVPESL